jgi:internalin A
MTQDELLALIDRAAAENWTELDLSGQGLTELPPEIGKLTQLKTLILGEYDQAKQLSSGNALTKLPLEISRLQNLQQLSLSANQITTIPDSVSQLQNLQQLSLSANQITTIPDSVSQLQNLQQLNLSANQITTIPDSVSQLQNLQQLNLSANQITTIPDSLEMLYRLEELDLQSNPLPISPTILGHPEQPESIFNYLHQLRSNEVRPLNEAKLLFVGQGGVGKTSLANRLLNDRFNPHESQTDGLTVRKWGVQVNAKDVRLNVWDFGGQEIYHATHQFFLTKRSLYLLVANCRTSEEENRLEYWLRLIQIFGGASPVIIVGNKRDEHPLDINATALRTKYPNICAIIETSCQTGKGINKLKQAITTEVSKLSEIYNLLPLSWFEVKEQLEGIAQDFIGYDEYIGICYKYQISTTQNQTQLIGLLHNLGLVLNFREHPILKDINVLKPNWVTEGIYALLSDDRLKTEGKGILTEADLNRVLDNQRYPADHHRYLTALMQEFQLCFALPDCSSPKFLIPGLLPKDEPGDISLKGDTLDFQYHYRILPEGVLSRFIVLSHEKIHQQTCWRSGVMLAYREGDETYNIARIKADPEENKIFIAVSGRETTRRVFLSLIRDTFAKIHNSFVDLEVTEWVPVPDHPDHPPLDYQELLGLEAMGERAYPIGLLRIRINLRQLLDGYEPVEIRQKRTLIPEIKKISEVDSDEKMSVNIFNYRNNLESENINISKDDSKSRLIDKFKGIFGR